MELAMTNDYAAIVAAVIAAVLVIGFVEMHAFTSKGAEYLEALLREEFPPTEDAEAATTRADAEPPSDAALDRYHATIDRRIKAGLFLNIAGVVWMVLCPALVVALCLITFWAAVDGHGPARWLATYSFAVSSLGVVAVAAGALARAILPVVGLYRLRSELVPSVSEREQARVARMEAEGQAWEEWARQHDLARMEAFAAAEAWEEARARAEAEAEEAELIRRQVAESERDDPRP